MQRRRFSYFALGAFCQSLKVAHFMQKFLQVKFLHLHFSNVSHHLRHSYLLLYSIFSLWKLLFRFFFVVHSPSTCKSISINPSMLTMCFRFFFYLKQVSVNQRIDSDASTATADAGSSTSGNTYTVDIGAYKNAFLSDFFNVCILHLM